METKLLRSHYYTYKLWFVLVYSEKWVTYNWAKLPLNIVWFVTTYFQGYGMWHLCDFTIWHYDLFFILNER